MELSNSDYIFLNSLKEGDVIRLKKNFNNSFIVDREYVVKFKFNDINNILNKVIVGSDGREMCICLYMDYVYTVKELRKLKLERLGMNL